jgi:hypothetical protein
MSATMQNGVIDPKPKIDLQEHTPWQLDESVQNHHSSNQPPLLKVSGS